MYASVVDPWLSDFLIAAKTHVTDILAKGASDEHEVDHGDATVV